MHQIDQWLGSEIFVEAIIVYVMHTKIHIYTYIYVYTYAHTHTKYNIQYAFRIIIK